ncbi:MAG: peptide chain release factor N(5)-glutamine methyltransferase [Pseudomonadota bacterium]
MKSDTVSAAARAFAQTLKAAGVPEPMRDARRIIAYALHVDPSRITLMAQEQMHPDALREATLLARARAARRPLSQLLGYRDFFGRRFRVTPEVLDPRPETETLVETALARPFERVLDLGTGSGAIMVTLLAERRTATGLATDVSEAALGIAALNAAAHGVEERIETLKSNWFESVPRAACFDLIVSNPPYISRDEMQALDPELAFEPRVALTDEADGLAAYRVIFTGAPHFLTTRGRIAVEIGATQGPAVAQLARTAGLVSVTEQRDLDGRVRVIVAQRAQ